MMKKIGDKPKAGLGRSTARKATPQERQAVRATGARKEARKGNLSEIYSEEKGGRLVTSKNSGSTAARTNTKSLSGKKSTADSGSAYGSSPGANKKKSIAQMENDAFYGDTKLGQRLVKKAKKVPGSSAAMGGSTYKKTPLKKRFQ
jgi:hypothetical protein